MDAPVNAPPAGEIASLVVVNGRQTGARQPLAGPLTLLGRAADCDVRLNVKSVQPHHAVLVQGPDGLLLRNLAGQGVQVNGAAASLCPVDHGDVIAVGPFQFRLERTGPSPRQVAEAERDALRIQAAAVAAQQAALNEEELRLRQRRAALEKQEEQLAGHLEARRRRLREIHEQMRREREEFQTARATAVEEQAALRKEAQAQRDAAAAMSEQVEERRGRLMELRRRLRLRERRHWQAREAALAGRDKEIAAREGRVQQAAEKLKRERESLTAARLRFNGDAELAKRCLREQWEELALAQQQWEGCLNQEHAEREKRGRELDARSAALEETAREWAGRERSQRLLLADLQRESRSLETRVANQRRKLAQEEAAAARVRSERRAIETPAAPPPLTVAAPAAAAPESPDGSSRALVLQRVAGDLDDQRAHLLEQWQTLLRVQEEWRQERQQALAGMETVARSLQEWEQWLHVRQQDLDAAGTECRQRQQALGRMRHSLEGWHSRLRMREAGWDAERVGLLDQARAREAAAARVMKRLQDMARRRHAQHGKEMKELAAVRTGCEELRRQYVGLWEECQRRRKEISQEQRGLAARLLAVERWRVEVVGEGPEAAKAERRLERIEQRYVARLTEADQQLEEAREGLAAEIGRLEELAGRVQKQQDEWAGQHADVARQVEAWEKSRTATEDADERRRLDIQVLCSRHEQDTRMIAHLQDELERTVRLLMDEPGEAAPSVQAA